LRELGDDAAAVVGTRWLVFRLLHQQRIVFAEIKAETPPELIQNLAVIPTTPYRERPIMKVANLLALATIAAAAMPVAQAESGFCEIPTLSPGVPYTVHADQLENWAIACGHVWMNQKIVRVDDKTVIKDPQPIQAALDQGRPVCERLVNLRLADGGPTYIVRLVAPRGAAGQC